MHYLVTGGCGFIGSHLCDALLAAGHRVSALDDLSTGKRDNLPASATLIEADIADAATVTRAMHGVDGCFHLAAIASVERCRVEGRRTHDVNVGGTENVFAAAFELGKLPVVYASSAAIYGDNPKLPLSESETPAPLSAYGEHKLANEHTGIRFRGQGVANLGLRFFNCYGPRQDPASPYSGVISIFSQRLSARQPITIFGTGEQTRDFIYVGDVVAHMMAAMEKISTFTDGAALNVCTGKSTSLLQLVDTLATLTGNTEKPNFGPAREGDIVHSLGDPSRATEQLGLHAKTHLQDGLAALLQWQEAA